MLELVDIVEKYIPFFVELGLTTSEVFLCNFLG